MPAAKTKQRIREMACAMLIGVAAVGPVQAQDAKPATAATAPSESAMVNLVRLLVKQKVLGKEAGELLMAQAEAEAAQARATAATAQAQAAQTQMAQAQTAQGTLPDPAPGTIRVPYIPETVRNQIRDQIRAEVLAQAKAEGWASADQAAPEWTRRVTLFGDVRVQSQSELYSDTNSQLIFDFQRINEQGPTNLLTGVSIPYLNSRFDRWNRLRLRVRAGAKVNVTKGIDAVVALATGDDLSPISTNVSLGGGLAKRSIWLDQAYVKIARGDLFNASFGRFPNPFVHSEMLFDEDLRFDGVLAEFNAGKLISDGFTLSVRGGAFPLDFGSPNFPDTSIVKQKTPEKYLYSGQITAGVYVNNVKLSTGAAYHSFQGVQGRFSAPCALYLGATECSTDPYRVFTPRKGNSLFGIRNIVADPANPNAGGPQLLGLTFDYDILDINASARVPISTNVAATLTGTYLRNMSFRPSDVCRFGDAGAPLNNGGAGGTTLCSATDPQPFVGGPSAYQIMATLGYDLVVKRAQWNAFAGYRYLESDAVLDSLTDSDFHFGGTNTKGYFIGGRYGIFDNVSVGGRWLSANEISGQEPLAIDILQFEIEARF